MRVILLTAFIFLIFGDTNAQVSINISGFTEEVITKERITGVTVFYKEKSSNIITNDAGYYSIKVKKGDSSTLIFSHASFETLIIKVFSYKDTFFSVVLKPLSKELQEIQIQNRNSNDDKSYLGTVSIPVKKLAKLPTLFGEKDVIKAIQLLPGVQTGNEGNAGFYVRGGGADQNLILLDGITIYNVSHLFGFFSLFPTDAVKSVDLIKGGFPARYGGRLSSVLDIKLKDGNKQKYETNYNIGLLSSKFSVEGPIKKNGSSFIFTGRRTYFDVLTKPFLARKANSAGYNFYDGIAKLNFILSERSSLSVSAYNGKDKYNSFAKETYYSNSGEVISKSNSNSGLEWGNSTFALRYGIALSSKINFNQSVNYTSYYYNSFYKNDISDKDGNEMPEKSFSFLFRSSIKDISYKSELDWFISNKLKLKSGIGYIHHIFNPSSALVRTGGNGQPVSQNLTSGNIRTNTAYLFSEADYSITDKVLVNMGVHSTLYVVNNRKFFSAQPRLNGKFQISNLSNLQYSFSYILQPIHLLTNNGPGLPVDLWVPATPKVPPQNAWQYSLGYLIKPKKGYEISLDIYYKIMNGLIEYGEGANFLNSTLDWEKRIEIGKGISYGAELFMQKKVGVFSGWVGYTLSWNKRKFANLNNNNWFWYKYDHRHDLKVVLIYEPSKKFDLSFNFVLHSGNKITIPDIAYNGIQGGLPATYTGFMFDINSQYILNASQRNNFNYKIYHRSDVSFNFNKEKKRGTRIWNISIYNVYSRLNPYFYYLKEDSSGKLTLTSFSLFPILPSVSYQFKWK